MAQITFKGNPIHTNGHLPEVGAQAPPFKMTGVDLKEVALEDFDGHKLILNIVPSVDTGICAASARRFNEAAASVGNAKILTISLDLPFAMHRFCGAEGIAQVVMLSGFKHPGFGQAYGVTMTDGPLRGLYSRAVVVLDARHRVVYSEQVPEIAQEPDYQAALEALANA